MPITRRDAMKRTLLAGAGAMLPAQVMAQRRPAPSASIGWIDREAPALSLGQTFGVPWPRGQVRDAERLAAGAVPVQSWATAYWPDGSIKWSAHALPAGIAPASVTIAPGRPALPPAPIRVAETTDAIRISTGDTMWEIARGGDAVVRSASSGGRTVLGETRLVAAVSANPAGNDAVPLTGSIAQVTIEQRGPVRAVVKVEGWHQGGDRRMLPFVVRLYAYAGSRALRIVHSFVHDGAPEQDFVTSLGVAATVPMSGALHDRHVRIATGPATLFAEAVRPLTGLRRDPGRAFREAQVAGRAVPRLVDMAPAVRDRLDRIPGWSDFRLNQLSANGATLAKRTGEGRAWIDADEARRAPGLGYVGGPQGGAAIGLRWFWERHPTGIDVRGAAGDAATLTAWLWSPDAAPMDLRSYRGVDGMDAYPAQNEGLDVTYEDYEPGWDDARGIARTSELTLWALPATPPASELLAMAGAVSTPPQMMADPGHIHAAQVFGPWGLPDRSTPPRARIEAQLADLTDFYAGEVDRRSWYGFWDHGDVMHTYDADRHQWRYDIGGFAWANSELSPDLWLWYQALRTRDAATWRLAEAMTRHTGEVDVYHLGRFKGLGTRHGVQHFSDSSKQPRVSNAAYRRIYYYLTADDRVGDLMRDLLRSDSMLQTIEIGRKVPGGDRQQNREGVVGMAFGTSWCSLAAAWLTEWERTRNPYWRDRLVAGMESIGAMPNGWLSGAAPYDLKTGRFDNPGPEISFSHLNAVFGAVEVNAELLQLLDVPGYRKAWLDYCRWYNAPRAEFVAVFGPRRGSSNLREAHSRLTAYAAVQTGDPALARRAAAEFYSGDAGLGMVDGDPRTMLPGGQIEWRRVSTNAASQWGLAAIQNLALVPDALDSVL
ncbi:exo-rhamnogalacturonan lyase family protein [Sphingomonas sp. 37zxx]|uniref:exo-rhamnogalacturonan lyase family protein n=1 Tax=Sphingomonas sp. 37zxx TaxID=1550073 RepID=UPI00053BEABE|nr:hypothetical protein [Sphingomonas sp. 37zxx]